MTKIEIRFPTHGSLGRSIKCVIDGAVRLDVTGLAGGGSVSEYYGESVWLTAENGETVFQILVPEDKWKIEDGVLVVEKKETAPVRNGLRD